MVKRKFLDRAISLVLLGLSFFWILPALAVETVACPNTPYRNYYLPKNITCVSATPTLWQYSAGGYYCAPTSGSDPSVVMENWLENFKCAYWDRKIREIYLIGGLASPTYGCVRQDDPQCTEEKAIYSYQKFGYHVDWVYGAEDRKATLRGSRSFTCDDAGWLYYEGDPNYFGLPICWRMATNLSLSIEATEPIIPAESRVSNKKVLTKSKLALSLRRGTQPVSGESVALKSTRGAQDILTGPVVTDAAGLTSAEVSTRNQPGSTTVTAFDTKITTVKPGVVQWFPANYGSEFLVTCYVSSEEAIFSAKRLSQNVCGLNPKKQYRTGFIEDTKIQGSGLTVDGTYIHYNLGTGCFNEDTCPRTAALTCATANNTIAVDPKIIPNRPSATVNVAILGERRAEDAGGGIKVYHIDEYSGLERKACLAWGKSHYSNIQFLSY